MRPVEQQPPKTNEIRINTRYLLPLNAAGFLKRIYRADYSENNHQVMNFTLKRGNNIKSVSKNWMKLSPIENDDCWKS